MEDDGGSSAAAIVTIPAVEGGSTITALEAKTLASKDRSKLVPQLQFPPGYHFKPTDFELLDVYLRGKLDGQKPPLDIFMQVDFLEWEPSKLIAERKAYGEDKYFFFTKRKAMPSSKDDHPPRMFRAGSSKTTGSEADTCGPKGSWKATGSVANICRPETTEVVGTRRMLIYSPGFPGAEQYTMKEYVLTGTTVDEFVLCTVKLKQRGNATEKKDKNASSGKDKKASGGEGKKRKRQAKPKKSTRKKKTATSQPQETQQQEQNEVTPYISSDPLLLLALDQVDHHQALQEGDAMAFDETNLMIQAVAPRDEYTPVGGDQPDYHDPSTQQETAWDGLGEPPLMIPAVAPHDEYPVGGDQPYHHDTSMQQETIWDGLGEPPLMQAYQASEQFHTLDQQYMLEGQFSTMAQFLPPYPVFQYLGQQQQPHNSSELLPLPHQLVQHQFHYGPKPGFHENITGTLQDALPQFLQESGKTPQTSPQSGKPSQTSPDTVLGGPDPGLPSGDDRLYYDSDIGMMNGVASPVVPQATSYGSASDHQFDPVNFPGHDFDNDNLAGNGGGSHVAMELPDHGSNRDFHTCDHGFQWWCGEPQNCDWCVALCALCHSISGGK